MRNEETGEFELVVGNRQLLSGFFIVVLLFAVAFAMGYVVGQNAPRSAKVSGAAPPAAASVPESRPQPSVAPPAVPPPSQPADSAPSQAAEAQGQPSTQPARDANAPPPAAEKPAAESGIQEAPAGSYWQVIVGSNPDTIQSMLKTLKDHGFPALLSPGPNNWTRVLVGPYGDVASMSKAKTALEGAGFRPVKYTRE